MKSSLICMIYFIYYSVPVIELFNVIDPITMYSFRLRIKGLGVSQ